MIFAEIIIISDTVQSLHTCPTSKMLWLERSLQLHCNSNVGQFYHCMKSEGGFLEFCHIPISIAKQDGCPYVSNRTGILLIELIKAKSLEIDSNVTRISSHELYKYPECILPEQSIPFTTNQWQKSGLVYLPRREQSYMSLKQKIGTEVTTCHELKTTGKGIPISEDVKVSLKTVLAVGVTFISVVLIVVVVIVVCFTRKINRLKSTQGPTMETQRTDREFRIEINNDAFGSTGSSSSYVEPNAPGDIWKPKEVSQLEYDYAYETYSKRSSNNSYVEFEEDAYQNYDFNT